MYERTSRGLVTLHPLKAARAALGLSQTEYARRVARELKAELGFEPQVKTHHGVLRWEMGTHPGPPVQRAIARLHQVPQEAVERLGWPHFLALADDAMPLLLSEDSTPSSAVRALRSTAWHTIPRLPPHLAATGPVLENAVAHALRLLAAPPAGPTRQGHPVTSEILDHIEIRLHALELQASGSPATPMALHYATSAEHRLLVGHLSSSGYDRRTGIRLLILAARAARLCGCFASSLGDEALSERYNLAALQAAAMAGAHDLSAICLGGLIGNHVRSGRPHDVLSLADVARRTVTRPDHPLSVVLLSLEASAHALLKDATSSNRALSEALNTSPPPRPDQTDRRNPAPCVDSVLLSTAVGVVHLHLRQLEDALAHFAPLVESTTPGADISSLRHYAPSALAYAVNAQLALGDTHAAVATLHRVNAALGTLPPRLADRYRQLFAPHRTEKNVCEALALLDVRITPTSSL